MDCTNCGKDIPFWGDVCPWCHADKSEDKRRYLYAVVGATTVGVVCLFSMGFLWALGGALVGGFCGGAVAIILTNRKTQA